MHAKLILGIIAVLLVAGCTQQGGYETTTTQPSATTTTSGGQTTSTTAAQQPGVKEFRVTVSHTFYSPSSFIVTKGDTVRLLAVAAPGTSSHNHGIAIDEYAINQPVTVEDASNPVTIEFVADKAGSFRIYCKPCWDGPFGRNHPDIQATLVVQ
ncbi:MAG: cupredoxin domain-containing protein [Candidatus Aenigmarchaeota archaeon]|nr:cupredoxin domain-containing protein [Candidatus Aenigmarchaeota archaeon]